MPRDPAEAATLSDGAPSVAAGRLAYDVMERWVGAGSLAFREPAARSATAARCPTTELKGLTGRWAGRRDAMIAAWWKLTRTPYGENPEHRRERTGCE
jgi:hypothetical protein